jgi:hypothetical protein
MNAQITSSSQTNRLREQLERSQVSHGGTVRADIPRVRVGTGVAAGIAAEGQLFFCDVEPIRIRRQVEAGDSAPLPETVRLEGIEFPEPGEYDVLDAIVTANGDISIVGDAATEVRRRSRIRALVSW